MLFRSVVRERLQKVWTEEELQSLPDDGSLTQRRLIGPGGELDGEHLLPGFRYPINDLFKDWDWE